MLRSLVGSEMCIRDSCYTLAERCLRGSGGAASERGLVEAQDAEGPGRDERQQAALGGADVSQHTPREEAEEVRRGVGIAPGGAEGGRTHKGEDAEGARGLEEAEVCL